MGQAWCYTADTAHKVSRKKAKEICETLNRVHYLTCADEKWYTHEIDRYDRAWEVAQTQQFIMGKRGLREKHIMFPCALWNGEYMGK